MSFADAFTKLIGNEGGYVDNQNDPGGATMWGVTQRVATAWGYTGAMQDLPQSTAYQIAQTQYWNPYQCDQLDPRVAFQVLDAAYNGGHPAQWLQRAVGVTADGIIGAMTIAAARLADPLKTIMKFDAYRLQYLASLNNPTFADGWMNRIANNLLLASA